MVSLQFAFVQETTGKRQQSRCFCYWTKQCYVNCMLHVHVIWNTNKSRKNFWQACTNIFCGRVGVQDLWKLITVLYVWIYCCFQVQWQFQINCERLLKTEFLQSCIRENLSKAPVFRVMYTINNIIQLNTSWAVLTKVHWNRWRYNNCTAAVSASRFKTFLPLV